MDNLRLGRFADGSVTHVQNEDSENNASDTMAIRSTNQSFSASKEGMWNRKAYFHTESKPNNRRKQLQPELGSLLANKRARSPLLPDLTASGSMKATGNMFYKTKLCCEFEVGNCLFMDNCIFAHGVKELRERSWEERFVVSKRKDTFQVHEDLTKEGSSEYGKKCCSFLNEQAEERKSEAICLLPGNGSTSFPKASKWKTRMCYKWEQSGWCPFGEKCHFAHGYAELRGYDGELVNSGAGKSSAHSVSGPASAIPRGSYQDWKFLDLVQKTREVPARRWKGPDKISKIYGDWIDDL
ncbi:Zinc finger CCCH domain-containing protein 12 [Striga hermonthica]|uniref:Zinc finger CCCH domain-containing protein 12 n=1 Tax=Striga hermonthica TaxID=68872 RepID=A0A9N7RSA2_STRHE|nr:Zinc finger CCCH domain-containing protein 12 [Striga hermonthica]